ncbi:MAG: HD domain-containing protein [Xanthomonadaceae bacterium]|nr:HD domain-containing protein [Xanthomonadaceae bacterium]
MVKKSWGSTKVAANRDEPRGTKDRQSLQLSASLRVSLSLFVLMVVLGAVHSLWTIHAMQQNQSALNVAARMDHHFQRMVERGQHYTQVAPRNYPDFFRDVNLYYANLLDDIETMESMVTDFAQLGRNFDLRLWREFRTGLEIQIGDEPERPRLEWAAQYMSSESVPLLAATDAAHAGLIDAAIDSRERLTFSSIGLALATLLLAMLTTWLFRERVLKRISETSRAVRRMSDGQFDRRRRRTADDELGQLESAVGHLARRTEDMVDLLDRLNGANTLQEAIDRVPSRVRRQFAVEWLGLIEVHDGKMRLRACYPGNQSMPVVASGDGWPLSPSLLAQARNNGKAEFAELRDREGELPLQDPLLLQLQRAGMVSAVLLPVRDNNKIEAGLLLASRNSAAFCGWRGRWLSNAGHLIAQAFYRGMHVEQLGISMVRGLAELAEKRDPTTGQHLDRMQRYAGIIARELVERGVVDSRKSPRFAEQIETFAPLHDIGKVGISDSILLKPGGLTPHEIKEMRRHPAIGAEVLKAAGEQLGAEGEKLLAHAMEIALYHHEKYDGSGYPHGLAGDAIPMSARIVAVADVFDALTSERPYKKAWSEKEALDYLEGERGGHFDPKVLDAFRARIREVRRICVRFQDEHEQEIA